MKLLLLVLAAVVSANRSDKIFRRKQKKTNGGGRGEYGGGSGGRKGGGGSGRKKGGGGGGGNKQPKCANDWGEDGPVFHLHDLDYTSPLVYTFGPKAPGYNPVDPNQLQKDGNAVLIWARSDPVDPKTDCFPNGTWSELNQLKKRYKFGTGGQSGGITFMLANLNKFAGTLRDYHWHTNSHEAFLVLRGTARVTVCGTAGPGKHTMASMYEKECETFIIEPGGIWIAPMGFGHYVEQPLGNEEPLIGMALYTNTHTDAIDLRAIVADLKVKALAHDLDLEDSLVSSFYPNLNREKMPTTFDAAGPNYEFIAAETTCGDEGLPTCKYRIAGLTNLSNPETYIQTNKEAKHLLTSIRSALAYPTLGVEWTSRYDLDFPLSMIYTEVEAGGSTDMYWADNADVVYYIMVPEQGEPSDELYGIRVNGDTYDTSKESKSSTRKLKPGDLFMCQQGFVCYIHNKGTTPASFFRFLTSNQPTLSILKLNMQQMSQSVLASILSVERAELDGFSKNWTAHT